MGPLTLAEWLLVPVGFLAGIINVIAGGGSFLVLPLLVASGLSLSVANGTNRVAVVLQALAATIVYSRKEPFDRKLLLRMLPPLVGGSIFGAWCATRLDPKSLARVFGVLFILMAAAIARGPTLSSFGVRFPDLSRRLALPCLILIGVYGGFLQAGVGLWIVTAAIAFLGADPVRANAVKLPLVLAFTLPSLIIFAGSGQVDIRRGLLLAVGVTLGAVVGVRVVLWGGSRLILHATTVFMTVTGLVLLLRG